MRVTSLPHPRGHERAGTQGLTQTRCFLGRYLEGGDRDSAPSAGAVPGGERYAIPGKKAGEARGKPISWVFRAEVLEGEGSESDEMWWIQTRFGTNLVHTTFPPIIPLVHGLAGH